MQMAMQGLQRAHMGVGLGGAAGTQSPQLQLLNHTPK